MPLQKKNMYRMTLLTIFSFCLFLFSLCRVNRSDGQSWWFLYSPIMHLCRWAQESQDIADRSVRTPTSPWEKHRTWEWSCSSRAWDITLLRTDRKSDQRRWINESKLQTSDFRPTAERTGQRQREREKKLYRTFLYFLYLFHQRSKKKNL